MVRSTPAHPAEEKEGSLWTAVFMVLAVAALALTLWYGLQTQEFQVMLLGLVAAGGLVALALRPWRHATDRGSVALWVVGSLVLLVSLLSDFALAPIVAAGAGGGFVLGLAAARQVFAGPAAAGRRAT